MPRVKAKLSRKRCDQCAAAMINGIFCHEQGCVNQRKFPNVGSGYASSIAVSAGVKSSSVNRAIAMSRTKSSTFRRYGMGSALAEDSTSAENSQITCHALPKNTRLDCMPRKPSDAYRIKGAKANVSRHYQMRIPGDKTMMTNQNNTPSVIQAKHACSIENAAQFKKWIETRGGIAIWQSQDLGNPGQSWSTPALQADGKPACAPHWSCSKSPDRVIVSAEDVIVETPLEVARMKVAIKRWSGFYMVLTDASTKRVRKAVAAIEVSHKKAAWHSFDYDTQEAVIYIAGESKPLSEMTFPIVPITAEGGK